jgi:hypothetical protein
LKRRVGQESATPSSKTAQVDDRERRVEPPLKKYKRLFEANDPSRLPSEDNPSSEGGQSSRHPPHLDDGLVPILEHDTEQLSLETDGDGPGDGKWPTCEYDPEPNNGQNREAGSCLAVKMRNVETIAEGEAVEILSPKKKAREVLLRQPDIDETFLKALAAARKEREGKQPHDREFDVPSIPGLLSQDGPAQDFYALKSLGDEHNIRGNFMVVVEMDVAKRESATYCNTSSPLNSKANFKKFQKVGDLFTFT